MGNKTLTAVEWFVKEIQTRLDNYGEVNFGELAEEAKAMEKEQITQSHLIGLLRPIEMEATKQAEQYYNETYATKRLSN